MKKMIVGILIGVFLCYAGQGIITFLFSNFTPEWRQIRKDLKRMDSARNFILENDELIASLALRFQPYSLTVADPIYPTEAPNVRFDAVAHGRYRISLSGFADLESDPIAVSNYDLKIQEVLTVEPTGFSTYHSTFGEMVSVPQDKIEKWKLADFDFGLLGLSANEGSQIPNIEKVIHGK